MSENSGQLERLKLVLQIMATVAVPVIIAVIGIRVQETLSEKEVSKNYVQMAVDILKTSPTKESADLRQWAIAIVDKYSPVPVTANLREQLTNSPSFLLSDAVSGQRLPPIGVVDVMKEISVIPHDGGIVKFMECKKAKDKETVDWLLENYPGRFFSCEKQDEIGTIQFARKGSPEDPSAAPRNR